MMMIFGWGWWHTQVGCSGTWWTWAFVLWVNLSLFILFQLFYSRTYTEHGAAAAEKKKHK